MERTGTNMEKSDSELKSIMATLLITMVFYTIYACILSFFITMVVGGVYLGFAAALKLLGI